MQPYNSSAEAELLYSLIVKAMFENIWYQKPKKEPKTSTQHVDWSKHLDGFKLMWPITPRLLEKMEADTAYICLQSFM